MNENIETKAAVSVAAMARMVGLSRQRFNQLIGTTFPFPLYSLANRRPFYTEELQRVCIEVRRRNFGIDGRPVLFYVKGPRIERTAKPARPAKSPRKETAKAEYGDLLAAIRALGLVSVTADQIAAAVHAAFPAGVDGVDQGKVIRAVFLCIKRQNSADNVGR